MLEAEYTFSYPSPGFPQTGKATALLSAPNEIAYIPEWQWKYPSEPENAYCDLSHQTDTPVCVSNAEPVDPITKPLEIILKWSCQWLEGAGVSSEKKIVDRLYEMCPMGTKEGEPGGELLKYVGGVNTIGTAELISTGEGSCFEWSYYFSNLVRSQGIIIQVWNFLCDSYQSWAPYYEDKTFGQFWVDTKGTNNDEVPLRNLSGMYGINDQNYRAPNTYMHPYTSTDDIIQSIDSIQDQNHPIRDGRYWRFFQHALVFFSEGSNNFIYDPSFLNGNNSTPIMTNFCPPGDGDSQFDTLEFRTDYLNHATIYFCGEISVFELSGTEILGIKTTQICNSNTAELKLIWQLQDQKQ